MPILLINSKAEIVSPKNSFVSENNRRASFGDLTAIKATVRSIGFENSFMVAAVIIPSVPSEPMIKFLRS